MKSYWDSSALVNTASDPVLKARLVRDGGYTRTHTLSEIFSAFTGRMVVRMSASSAHKVIEALSEHLEFVDPTSKEIIDALSNVKSLGVQGARVYDYVHALAAKKCGAESLLTMDRNDFNGLVPELTIEQI